MSDIAAIAGKLSDIADHPERAFKVQTTVFLPETRSTSVRLARGECLFVLTDKGLDEAPVKGPDDVMICTEHFGCWPVVAIRVRAAHVERWRKVTDADCGRMMTRVRAALRDHLISKEML
jgi:hypothetical protein